MMELAVCMQLQIRMSNRLAFIAVVTKSVHRGVTRNVRYWGLTGQRRYTTWLLPIEDLRWAWPTQLRPPENGRGLIFRHLEWQKAMCTMCCAVLWSVLDAQEEVSCRFTEFLLQLITF